MIFGGLVVLSHPALLASTQQLVILVAIPTPGLQRSGPSRKTVGKERKRKRNPSILDALEHIELSRAAKGKPFPSALLVRRVSRLKKLDVHSKWKLTRAALIYIAHTWDLLITTTSP